MTLHPLKLLLPKRHPLQSSLLQSGLLQSGPLQSGPLQSSQIQSSPSQPHPLQPSPLQPSPLEPRRFQANRSRANPLPPVAFKPNALRPNLKPDPFKLRLLSLVVAAALPLPALAQDAGTTELDDVVVTATRTAITADDALASVDVIDRADIERSQAHSVPDLLRGRAGITIANQGGLGKLSTLFLRGTESDHVLVLVDGVRIGSATSGLAALQDLPIELIERIEVVRGPRSSLYGSDAIGGVIQVFTRRGSTDAGTHVRPRLHVGAGSHGLREAGGGVEFSGPRAWFGVDLAHQANEGINACRGTGAPTYAGCGDDDPDPDRDGYENASASVRGGLRFGEAWELSARALRAEGHNAYDANPAYGLPDNSDTLQQVVGGTLRYAPNDRVTLRLVAGRDTDASDNFLGEAFTDRFASTRDSASLQGDFSVGGGQLLTLGADWTRDRADVDSPYAVFAAARRSRAAFAQYQGRFGRHDLQLALRHDDNDTFGGHDTGSLAWGMDLAHGLRATASLGTAFKAPTFNELYYPYYGNPDLHPETSRSLEFGIAQRVGGWHWRLDAYQTRIDQLIVYDPNLFVANNIESARIRGIELGAGATLAGWDIAAQAGWLEPVNDSPVNVSAGSDGRWLPRRARSNARLDADRAIGRWRVGASLVASGPRYDDVANTLRLGGYATLDLRAGYDLGHDWTLQASVRNAFDRDYETVAFYNQPGREFGLSLRYAAGD